MLFLSVTEIAIKLSKRDVSELSPTDIAIEVLSNFCLMPFLLTPFRRLQANWKVPGAEVESNFCIDAYLMLSRCILQALEQIDNFLKGEGGGYAEC